MNVGKYLMVLLKRINWEGGDNRNRLSRIFIFILLIIALKFLMGTIYYFFSLENYEGASTLRSLTPVNIILKSCILIPIYEESIFRLPLKFNMNYIRFSACLFLFDFFFLYETNRLFMEIGPGFSLRVIIFVFVVASVMVMLFSRRNR